MKNIRIQSLILGTLAMALVVLLVVQGTAALEARISDGVETILRSGHEGVRFKLEKPRAQMIREVQALTSLEGLASDFRYYIEGLGELTPTADGAVSAFITKKKQRIIASKERLEATVAEFLKKRSTLSGITLVDTLGFAVISNSTQFPVAKKLPFEKYPGLDSALKGNSVYWMSINDKYQFVAMVLAPVRMRNGVMVGLAMVEHVVNSPLADDSKSVFVLEGKKVLYGKGPRSMVVPGTKTKLIFPIAQMNPFSRIVGVGQVGLAPLFVDSSKIDIQALEFSVPGNVNLRGFVTVDPSSVYSELGGVQYTLILLALVLWLLNLTLGIAASKSVLGPANAIADSIGATLQGTIAEPVDDSLFPQEMARLNRLVTKLLEKKKDSFPRSGASMVGTPAPSAAELYGEGSSLADFASMDFYSSSSAVNLDELAFGPVSAPAEIVGAGGATRPPATGGVFPPSAPLSTPSDMGSPMGSGALGLESGPLALDLPPAFTAPAAPSVNGSALADLFSNHTDDSDASSGSGLKQSGAVTNPAFVNVEVPEVLSDDFDDEKMAEWDDLGLEPLPDYDNPPSSEEEESVPLGGSTQSSFDYGATSVMKVSPELIAQMRARDPEAYDDEDSTVQGGAETEDSTLFPDSAPALGPIGMQAVTLDSFAQVPTPPAPPAPAAEDDGQVSQGEVPASTPIIPPAPPPPPMGEVTAVEDNSALKAIYDEFMATRRSCGESTDLPYEKFVARLEKSQDAVKTKHGCRDVKFQVYVKNGKAALKASPIR